ncbi:DUF2500 family protein [Enterococcus sp. LJL98]
MSAFGGGLMVDSIDGTSSLFSFFFGLVGLLLLVVMVYKLSEMVKNTNAMEEVCQARLIDKIANKRALNRGNYGSTSTSYTLVFELSNGERKSFDVSRKDYLAYVVGDTGRLSFQRKRLNDFQI